MICVDVSPVTRPFCALQEEVIELMYRDLNPEEPGVACCMG